MRFRQAPLRVLPADFADKILLPKWVMTKDAQRSVFSKFYVKHFSKTRKKILRLPHRYPRKTLFQSSTEQLLQRFPAPMRFCAHKWSEARLLDLCERLACGRINFSISGALEAATGLNRHITSHSGRPYMHKSIPTCSEPRAMQNVLGVHAKH